MKSLSSRALRIIQTKAFKVGFSLLLLYLVTRNLDFPSVGSQITRVQPLSLVAYFTITLVTVWLSAWRWMLWTLDKPSAKQLAGFIYGTFLGFFYNLFLPSTVGGDAVKWTALLRHGHSKKRLIFSVVADRGSGAMGIVALGFAGVLYLHYTEPALLSGSLLLLFSLLMAVTVAFTGYIMSPWRLSAIPLLKKLRFLEELETALKERKAILLKSLAWSLLIQVIAYYAMYVLSEGLYLGISLVDFFVYGSVTSLLLILPISLAGFGVTEVSYVFFFTQHGATKEGVLALAAVLNIFKIILGLIGWGLDLMVKASSKNRAPQA